MDAVVEMMVMVMVMDIGMIMVVVIMLVLLEYIVMMEDKVPKWLAKVILQAGIVVPSMVMDLVMEHIIIDYLGHRHWLFTCFIYGLVKKKVKEKVNMFV
jgi:hypothetical protein